MLRNHQISRNPDKRSEATDNEIANPLQNYFDQVFGYYQTLAHGADNRLTNAHAANVNEPIDTTVC